MDMNEALFNSLLAIPDRIQKLETTIGEQWIVISYRSGAHQDCIVSMSQFLSAEPGLFARNPTRVAGPGGNSAVQRDGQFQMNKRPPGGD